MCDGARDTICSGACAVLRGGVEEKARLTRRSRGQAGRMEGRGANGVSSQSSKLSRSTDRKFFWVRTSGVSLTILRGERVLLRYYGLARRPGVQQRRSARRSQLAHALWQTPRPGTSELISPFALPDSDSARRCKDRRFLLLRECLQDSDGLRGGE